MRDADAAVRGRVRGHRRIAVDGEPAQEEVRVEHPGRKRPRNLAVDVPEPDRRVPRRSGRDVDDPHHAPVVDLEQHLLRLVDLEVMPVAEARVRRVCALQAPPDVRRDPSRAGEAVHLLEGDDRIGGVVRVEAVDPASRVVELGEASLDDADARAARPERQVGQEDVRADGLLPRAERPGGRDRDPHPVVGDARRAQAQVRVVAEGLRRELVARAPDAELHRPRPGGPELGTEFQRPADDSGSR